MATEADIQQRIAEEQAKIQVPSYQDAAWDGAWKRRAASMWGCAAEGMIMGGLIGLGVPLFTVLGGMHLAAAAALIPTSIAVFSAIGITAGWAIGVIMGPSAGAAASTMKEYERRQIAREIEDKIRKDPDAVITLVEERALQKEEDKEKNAKWSDYYRFKPGIAFALIGAIGGLVFANALLIPGVAAAGMEGAFLMPAAKLLLGAAASSPTIMTAYSVGVGACFGANFGVSHALISRKIVNFSSDLLSGKAFGDPWAKSVNLPDPKPILSPVVSKPAPAPSVETSQVEGKHCAACAEKAPMKNYEALVTRSIAEADRAVAR